MKLMLLIAALACQEKRQVEISSDINLEIKLIDASGEKIQEISQKSQAKFTEEKTGAKLKIQFIEHSDPAKKGKTFTIDGNKVLNEEGKEVDISLGNWQDVDNISSALKGTEFKVGQEWEYQLSKNTSVTAIDVEKLPKIKCKITEITEKATNINLGLEHKGIKIIGQLSVRLSDLKPLSLKTSVELIVEQTLTDKFFDRTKKEDVVREVAKVITRSKSIKTVINFTY